MTLQTLTAGIEPPPPATNGHVTGPRTEDVVPETFSRDFRAALRVVLPIVPFLGLIFTVLLYSTPLATGGRVAPLLLMDSVLLTGSLWTLALALLASTFYYWFRGTAADHANSRSYGELAQRLRGLNVRCQVFASENLLASSERAAAAEVQAYIAAIRRELGQPGLRWILGIGYINMWNLVHRAEEALIQIEAWNDVVRGARADERKIQGSAIGGSAQAQMLDMLGKAVTVLQAAGQPPESTPGAAAETASLPSVRDVQDARSTLRGIRQTVNDFRDDTWDGVVRARNHALAALGVTGLFSFLLLGLALTGRPSAASALEDPIIAAAAFYVVGAIVGLFKRLSDESSCASDVEDYGLGTARLALIPMLSGLAAVGGAFLVAMVPAVVSGGLGSATAPDLGTIFTLARNPYGLVFAAIFGLSPSLLITTIGRAADQYKLDLQNSEAAQSPAK